MRVLLTGAAGFIGFHSALELLKNGHQVYGYDNVNDYYDPKHKEARLEILRAQNGFTFLRGDLSDNAALTKFWEKSSPTHVLHLAAQAGVRYSLQNPMAYIHSNLVGFQNIIELVRHNKVENFVYASSSSVYGGNKVMPFSEKQTVNRPISLYAATKLSNELVATSYCHLYDIPATGLRFFTVYGPHARPDMAMYRFAERMIKNEPIPVYNQGKMVRDFTYVGDIVNGIMRSLAKPEKSQVYNLGYGRPMELLYMVSLLEKQLGLKAKIDYLPMQAGDVEATLSDISHAKGSLGYEPKTKLEDGVKIFCEWFLKHHRQG